MFYKKECLGLIHIALLLEENLQRPVTTVSSNEYLPVEERGNIINGGAAKLHKLQPETQPNT